MSYPIKSSKNKTKFNIKKRLDSYTNVQNDRQKIKPLCRAWLLPMNNMLTHDFFLKFIKHIYFSEVLFFIFYDKGIPLWYFICHN